ncbi:DUF1320 family protein [Riemerella anatipestifer]|uniref:DUF1320 family protein n=3 Tax=Riemerella anatipestifer TaxID=34085 RepID=A0AAP3EWU7_RIEAN|nr:phage protein Gp36 family protein [Riemerella anatipestifer]AZZ57562.1 DUF1320 domain-containing protein [Riemerella anatipestifer]AZZ57760.1 DUF1320 domain-containing protein [Riemerella anatipestifer]MBT0573848.1 DUF1320 family protein [Riemerella anatipestifer]MCU7567754.1 DUF1320 family protein [Riemerella anatipestifer]MCW0490594.1 DUF1320 family protein [Riemerella anatipestifer]
MYIEIEELKTHCHEEELKAIIQGDETIALACIDMAIEFASTKLMKDYDVNEIFAKTGNERSPLLVKIIKDIAVWEIIGLENPSVDYQDKKFRYEQAVNWLNAVYKGMPANLPKLEETEDKVKAFSYHSNQPRQNHY